MFYKACFRYVTIISVFVCLLFISVFQSNHYSFDEVFNKVFENSKNNSEKIYFPRRDPQDIKNKLDIIYTNLLSERLLELKRIRQEALKTINSSESFPIFPSSTPVRIIQGKHDDSNFKLLDQEAFGFVRFDVNINAVSQSINTNIFNFTLNTCSLANGKWKSSYNTYCTLDQSIGLIPKTLTSENFLGILSPDYGPPENKVSNNENIMLRKR